METFLKENCQELLQKATATAVAKVLVLNSGGTFGFIQTNPGINDDVHFVKGFIQSELQSGKYPHLDMTPAVEKSPLKTIFCQYWILELDPQLDSANMEMSDWTYLCKEISLAYSHFDGFVILHGTNTMDFTASALSFMIKVVGTLLTYYSASASLKVSRIFYVAARTTPHAAGNSKTDNLNRLECS
jgi:lysophospholipase